MFVKHRLRIMRLLSHVLLILAISSPLNGELIAKIYKMCDSNLIIHSLCFTNIVIGPLWCLGLSGSADRLYLEALLQCC